MKKREYVFVTLTLMLLFVYSCETREETKQPKADFSFTPTTDIAPGDEVTFNNLSTDAETYAWDFDDGATSVAQHPKHEFEEAGEYDVTLVVSNKNLKDQISKKVVVVSQVTACFTFEPSTAVEGEVITFSNCSEGAESYEWDIDSNGTIDSYDFEPAGFYFTGIGTYDIKLIAKAGSSTDEVVHSITITEGNPFEIDPTVYDLGEIWIEDYFDHFEETTDWTEAVTSEYSASIADGLYTIDIFDPEFDWIFHTEAAGMPSELENYDLEARMRVDNDNSDNGTGLVWGYNDSDTEYGYYTYRYLFGAFRMGDTEVGWYNELTVGGNQTDYNKFTIRLYKGNYYYFLNEEYLFTKSHGDDFGEYFGFFVGSSNKTTIDWIGIWIMDLTSKKSAGLKSLKSSTNYSGKGGAYKVKNKMAPLK